MNYPDIYFHPDYARAHEIIENGTAVQFVHQSELGAVSYVFIKREIDASLAGNEAFQDIVSPYGYGGPIVLECPDPEARPELLKGFITDLSGYCRENRIVSEFIRFHPIEKNHVGMDAYYQISPIKRTLGTNLVDYGDPFQSEFSKRCRKSIEKCRALGMTFRVSADSPSMDAFYDIYTSTMNRNNALEFYYFDKKYFDNLLTRFPANTFIGTVFLDEKPIASGLYMNYGQYVHAHLSGTLEEFMHLSPAYLLKAEVVRWSMEHGYRFVHHGGGYTNSDTDGLFKFKKSFSQNTEFDFYVGKRIWNESAYDALTQANSSPEGGNSDFFPAYRQRS
jgi:hypothetical protein